MSHELPDKILLVRLGAIGDVANALVVANALADERPRVRVGWAVHDQALPLVEGHPSVARVHLWKRGSGLRGLRATLRAARSEGYGLAVDLQRILKSAWFARRAAGRVLGFDRRRAKEFSWLLAQEHVAPQDPGAHMVEQYMGFVRALGIEGARPRRSLPRDESAEAVAATWVERHGQPVLVNVGASKPENRWPPERFAELARALADRGEVVALTGGPADREPFQAALAAADGEGVHDRVGRTSLRELIALERRAKLFVGCDTGPMHLAAAVATPVVALFGPADPRRTGPYGTGHRVLRAKSVGGRAPTMDGLDTARVVAEVEAALVDRARP